MKEAIAAFKLDLIDDIMLINKWGIEISALLWVIS